MAIFQQFLVQIVVSGEETKEYDITDDDHAVDGKNEASFPSTVRKYIEAAPGQNFEVKISLQPGYKFVKKHKYFCYEIFLDGQRARSAVIAKNSYLRHGQVTKLIDGTRSGGPHGWLKKSFRFGELITTEDNVTADLNTLKEMFGAIGNITVEVWRYKGKIAKEQTIETVATSSVTVPEKVVKGQAITLAAEFDSPQKASWTTVWEGQPMDESPLATFTFSYRTKKSLQDLMIIERPASPTPIEDRDPETLNENELREIARLFRAERAKAMRRVNVKEEMGSRGVKRERQVSLVVSSNDDDDDLREVEPPPKRSCVVEIIEIDSD